jgi:tRNA uridine 5-carbamoylmethylation protein Kti12
MVLWNIVLSGYPSCGKTTLAKKLIMNKHRFIRVSSDDLRAMLFNKVFPCEDEELVYSIIGNIRDTALENHYNVVIDTTSPNNISREFLLKTKVKSVNSLLVIFDVKREILIERNKLKGQEDAVEIWDRYWELPSGDFPTIRFKNNNEEEFNLSYDYLSELLEGRIYPFKEKGFPHIFPLRKILGK